MTVTFHSYSAFFKTSLAEGTLLLTNFNFTVWNKTKFLDNGSERMQGVPLFLAPRLKPSKGWKIISTRKGYFAA